MNYRPNRVVALLPIKANSVRVKGKNFRDFCGKPLFRWTLDTLLAVKEIDQIIINTDARHILSENGLVDTSRITIRDRKPEICGDHVSMNLIISDDINSVPADIYLMTHSTNPLVSSDTFIAGLEAFCQGLNDGRHDSLFSVNRHQTRFYKSDCTPINHDPSNLVPTQELEPWFEENSCFYMFTARSFSSTGARIGRNPIMYELSKIESADIDEQSDWDFAEALMNLRLG
jgi:CMP-N-acetylneuraminic acid synthetase